MLSEKSRSYRDFELNTSGLRSAQLYIFCLFVWGRPDVSVIISSVNINVTFLALQSLPCPEIISHSQSASNKQIQGFSPVGSSLVRAGTEVV